MRPGQNNGPTVTITWTSIPFACGYTDVPHVEQCLHHSHSLVGWCVLDVMPSGCAFADVTAYSHSEQFSPDQVATAWTHAWAPAQRAPEGNNYWAPEGNNYKKYLLRRGKTKEWAKETNLGTKHECKYQSVLIMVACLGCFVPC